MAPQGQIGVGQAESSSLHRFADSLPAVARRHLPAIAGYALPFLLVVYLGLQGGGYDPIVRGEVGVAVWWLVLLGALAGALPAARVPRAGWAMLGLVGAFAAWTALGIGWSESSERSVEELGRLAAYGGVFALALLAQGREGLRRTAQATAAAIALIGIVALLSRLQPEWFSATDPDRFLDTAGRRLNYPLDYWNGLAGLIGLGLPLLVWTASAARHVATRALAAAALPALCLALLYTLSRGGAVAAGIGLAVLVALHPARLSLLPTLLVGGIGSGLAVVAALQRDALVDGLATPAAAAQTDEVLAIALITCAGVGLLQAAVALASEYEIGPRPHVSRSAGRAAIAIAAVALVVAGLAAGLPGEVSERWDEFKQPLETETTTNAERFSSASGNGRYQIWSSAVDAGQSEPLTGIGPGTFEFWWAREGSFTGFVRSAHSVFFEAFAELGVIGLALILGVILLPLGYGFARTRSGNPAHRAMAAAATAACAAFAVTAAIDWTWELPVLPVVFLLLAAALAVSTGREPEPVAERSRSRMRIGAAAIAVLALIATAIPLAGAASIRESQERVNAASITDALAEAETAQAIQPYAATPHMQEALIRELAGDLGGAAAAARLATEDEPTNWRTWFVLSRIEAKRGEVAASIGAYREARSLNPRSPLFAPPAGG
jgi:hypothetical protein